MSFLSQVECNSTTQYNQQACLTETLCMSIGIGTCSDENLHRESRRVRCICWRVSRNECKIVLSAYLFKCIYYALAVYCSIVYEIKIIALFSCTEQTKQIGSL